MEFTSTEKLYDIFLTHPAISTDTRTIENGSIFFALKGGNFNGNSFAKSALEKGAAYAVIDEEEFADDERCILVQNVLVSLQQLALHHRRKLGKRGLNVFALTGSNGKTTTKELLARVLAKKFNTLFTEGNLNNHIGVPLTLLKLKPAHEMAVIEMGANHQGEIAMLCSIAEPDFGLITNIGLAHLEGFGGPEGVLKGKTELFSFLRTHDGSALVLADDTRVMQISAGMKRMTYGTGDAAEVKGTLISADPFVKFSWGNETIRTHEVQTQMVGGYNLPNLLAACAAGVFFGIGAEQIDHAIASYAPSNARSQMEKRGSNKLILDCYNANPSSMAAAIENFSAMQGAKKIAVLGDMFELGETSADEHQRIADMAGAQLHDTTIVLVGKNFGQVKNNFNALLFPDAAAAAEWIKKDKPENALILIKGSRGMKMEQCADAI